MTLTLHYLESTYVIIPQTDVITLKVFLAIIMFSIPQSI